MTLALFHAISREPQYSDFAIKKLGFNDSGGATNDDTALRDQKGTPWAPPGPPPSFRTGSGGGPGTTPKNDKIKKVLVHSGPGPLLEVLGRLENN